MKIMLLNLPGCVGKTMLSPHFLKPRTPGEKGTVDVKDPDPVTSCDRTTYDSQKKEDKENN